ncbi:hypothetical protein NQF87_04550 [Bombella sp. TMW 2.2559]|uniref:Uncharacterized protein n=1 Tax=Bombella dulcis TaxID=2967339 RepID=A0ABT3WF46_9PROT|nr:hypothetical protein [Bombella dulcis]MCX5616243.1 hypothetical protein [Bombella dulcis]
MKTFFGTVFSLWKQAPLWRLCFIMGIGSMILAAFFPTPWLKQQAPWLPGTAPQTTHPSHGAASDETSTGHSEAETGPAGQMPVHLQYPSMSEVVRNHVVLGGHTIPLPRGEWHPILSAQISSDSPLSFLALVRTHQGAVTGLIIAQATQQPIPLDRAGNATSICHDDRNFLNHSLPLSPAGEDCIGSGTVVIQGSDVSTNPLINQSIARLQALGVTPIPPLFLAVQWRHVAATADGQAQVGLVDTLIPPLDSQTHQLLAPIPVWGKSIPDTYPEARTFLNQMRSWAPEWQKALQLGFDNQLQGHAIPRDP